MYILQLKMVKFCIFYIYNKNDSICPLIVAVHSHQFPSKSEHFYGSFPFSDLLYLKIFDVFFFEAEPNVG